MSGTEADGGDRRTRGWPSDGDSRGVAGLADGPAAHEVVESVRDDDPVGWNRGGLGRTLLPVVLAGVWLIYLTEPLRDILDRPAGARRLAGVAAVVTFSVAYVAVFFQARRRRWAALSSETADGAFRMDRPIGALVAVMIVCFVVMIPSAGPSSMAAVVYIAATVMMVTPLWLGWSVSLLGVVATEVAAAAVPGWSVNRGAGLAVMLASVAVFGMRMALRRSQQLAVARDDLARLAVEQERSRFARDLHDILGHSLTVVTLKAELAGRLVESDPQAAIRELADLERLSRDALADVRAAVAGYRGVTLVSELASAHSVLRAAGIVADLPTAVDHVPGRYRELFGWVVREGVTNVVRHSGAERCEVTLTPGSVEVLDDGRGHGSGGGIPGHGLLGLTERARAMGGTVVSGPVASGGFRLRVEVPQVAEPASAAQVVTEPAPRPDARSPFPARAWGASPAEIVSRTGTGGGPQHPGEGPQ